MLFFIKTQTIHLKVLLGRDLLPSFGTQPISQDPLNQIADSLPYDWFLGVIEFNSFKAPNIDEHNMNILL